MDPDRELVKAREDVKRAREHYTDAFDMSDVVLRMLAIGELTAMENFLRLGPAAAAPAAPAAPADTRFGAEDAIVAAFKDEGSRRKTAVDRLKRELAAAEKQYEDMRERRANLIAKSLDDRVETTRGLLVQEYKATKKINATLKDDTLTFVKDACEKFQKYGISPISRDASNNKDGPRPYAKAISTLSDKGIKEDVKNE